MDVADWLVSVLPRTSHTTEIDVGCALMRSFLTDPSENNQ
jgi:hypothetical protein